ncbi:MAG: hypothetical protein WAK88_03280 [Candidatus Cybelea sp.]
MKTRLLSRYALSSCAAAAMLAACGGSRPPIGAQGAMPQTSPIAAHAERGKSWMLPGTSSGDLLYATGGCEGACVLSYPDLKLVGGIADRGISICSDSQGNIFLPRDTTVTEYAHGGTSPVATLTLPGNASSGCSVDPITNDLAVVFQTQVAIFQNEQGNPSVYLTHIDARYCTYDADGNLFVNGYGGNSGAEYALAELASGASAFTTILVSNSVGNPGQLQWDGKFLAYQDLTKYGKVSQLQIAGSSASIVGTISFKGVQHQVAQSWLYDGQIAFPYNIRGQHVNVISTWRYPKGGKAANTIRKFDSYKKKAIEFLGVTVSVAPH